MGLKECSRRGCNEIMCVRHSNRHGYICEDCFKELKEKEPETHQEVEEFFRSRKKLQESINDLDEEFSMSKQHIS